MLQSSVRRGELDRQIIFIQKVIGTGAANEDAVNGWELIEEDPQVWAKVRQSPGSEVVVADQIQSTMSTSFIIDYRTDITTEMRIIYNEKYFNIISPPAEHEGSRGMYLLIMADQVPNEEPTIEIVE
jgi:SPP1 family predicted phage head-tail adaptor